MLTLRVVPAPVDPPISGACDARFHALREAFRENFAREGEWGAAVCALVGGRVVADLWGGWVDAERRRAWQRETLVNAYSAGKGVLAILALGCVESGEIELDAPLSRLWPELAAARTDALTFRALLAHRAGLPGVLAPLSDEDIFDWERMCAALAAQPPFWEPGSAHGYHVNTLGFLVGEVLRRATGLPPGGLVKERLAQPLDAPFYWGVPPEVRERIAPVQVSDVPSAADAGALENIERDPRLRAVYFNPPGFSGFGTVNTAAWRGAAIPSANGHTHARALARIYEAYRVGRTGVGAGLRAEAARPHSDGEDRVLHRPTRFGLTFQLPHARRPLGPSPHAVGHFGYGGSLGLVDTEAELAFGYVNNLPGERFRTPRTDRLLEAHYTAL